MVGGTQAAADAHVTEGRLVRGAGVRAQVSGSPPSLKLSGPTKESYGPATGPRSQDSGGATMCGPAGPPKEERMSPRPPRAPERAHAPTSFLPSLMPYQALQLGAIATGPKQLKKSLRESHAGCHSCHQPKPGARRSDTPKGGSPGSSQKTMLAYGQGQLPGQETQTSMLKATSQPPAVPHTPPQPVTLRI